MISEKVYKLCTSSETVSSLLAKDPTLAPGDAWNKLYGGHAQGQKESKSTAKAHRDEITPEDLKRALECGNWGPTQPSELFLRLYHDALCTLDKNVAHAMVSPPLMGSCGVIPLTVISVVPDIMRHMSNLIVRAEKEVILATNYWQNSVASKFITDAMKELSRRAGERGVRIVMKMEYDRGSPKQLLDDHYVVSQKEYLGKAVALPAPDEIPNIDLEVINYHRPMLGTFHCKYMVVDRKYAVLQSNNIQDNDNMEMMVHLEGPIVDSLYDMALISWHKKLEPPLPSHNTPAVQGGLGSFGNKSHGEMFGQDGALKGHSAVVHPERMREQKAYNYEPKAINQPGVISQQVASDTNTAGSNILTGPSTNESILHPVGQASSNQVDELSQRISHTNVEDKPAASTDIGSGGDSSGHHMTTREKLKENATVAAATGDFEHIQDTKHSNGPSGGTYANDADGHNGTSDSPDQNAVNGSHDENSAGDPYQRYSYDDGSSEHPDGPDTQTKEYFGSGDQTLPQSQIEQPSPAGNLLPEHTTENPHYDVDIAGEVARVQTAVSPKQGETRMEAVTRHLNHTRNKGFKGNASECAPREEMTPYIPHPVHEPFPISMVCREPYGSPNHSAVYNPQNEVWLSALRNAKKNVFIQSPTLNAEPLVPAIIESCERGIDVYCYICLGYNDTGELLPKQGGTNEMIAHKMYQTLSKAGKSHLHYFFYVGKDQTGPIVAKKKKRSCHVKVMIVDEHIGIQGNGNQDTQSWYHSQEINIMFDNAPVCKAWIDGLRRNQNTAIYGEVSKEDGIWRDANGNQSPDTIGVDPGKFSWAKGFMGAINRVRGTGDF